MSNTNKTGRNAAAVSAHMRGGAGAMRDKRAPRGGARNVMAEFMAEVDEDLLDADEMLARLAAEESAIVNPFADEMEGMEVIWHGCMPYQN